MTTASPPVQQKVEGRDRGVCGRSSPIRSWHRDFTLLWRGSAISQLGTIGAASASPLLALALTDSPVVAGWVSAASATPGLLLHLPAGVLVDRYDRRKIMWYSQVVRTFNAFLLCLGLLFLAQPWVLLIVAAAIDGSCAAFYRIAEIAAVQQIVPAEELEASMGKNEARQHMAVVLGRPFGGMLLAAHRALPYGVDALTSAFSLLSLGMLRMKMFRPGETPVQRASDAPSRESLKVAESPPGNSMDGFKEGFRQLVKYPFVWVTVGACAIANMLFQTVILLLVVEAEREHMSSSLIGVLLATSGVSGLAGALLAPRIVHRWSSPAVVAWSVVLWLPAMAVVAISAEPIAGMIAWGLCSFMGAQINVALAVHQAKIVPGRLLGRVEGINRFLTTGAIPFGASGGGYVIAAFGPRFTALLVVAAFAVLAFAVPALLRKRGAGEAFALRRRTSGRTPRAPRTPPKPTRPATPMTNRKCGTERSPYPPRSHHIGQVPSVSTDA